MVEYLLSCRGVDVNVVDRFSGTPLEDAIREGHASVSILLEKHGARRSDDPILEGRKQVLRDRQRQRLVARSEAETKALSDIAIVNEACDAINGVMAPLSKRNKHLAHATKALLLTVNGRTSRSHKVMKEAPELTIGDVSSLFLSYFRKFMKDSEHALPELECYLGCVAFNAHPSFEALDDMVTKFFTRGAISEVDVDRSDVEDIRAHLANPQPDVFAKVANELYERLETRLVNFVESQAYRDAMNSGIGRLWRVLGLAKSVDTQAREIQEECILELERVVQFETVIHIFGRDRTDRVTQLAAMLAHYDQLLSSLRKAVKDIAVASKVLHKRSLEQEQALAHPAWSPRRRRGSLQTTTTSEFKP